MAKKLLLLKSSIISICTDEFINRIRICFHMAEKEKKAVGKMNAEGKNARF